MTNSISSSKVAEMINISFRKESKVVSLGNKQIKKRIIRNRNAEMTSDMRKILGNSNQELIVMVRN